MPFISGGLTAGDLSLSTIQHRTSQIVNRTHK